jgi:homopolymeric O-antigen transport system ATP-binding protein
MSDVAIQVSGLAKRFEIGTSRGGYQLLTEAITDRVRSLGQRTPTREFWALSDIDFEVKRGETMGIIGHNGAGKSTLLKILSRISPPTRGEVRLRGRVGALLEVGTGFHPELTGRENVFLNGAILHMSRREIEQKFDEIVEFADIGPFIDTPVKRYSSGMQLRLAFSVAAHLEPEILIIDEVLSVGDLAFQRKCLGRMENAAAEGRTILFISHNLPAVQALCDRAILLRNGQMAAEGEVSEVVDAYVSTDADESHVDLADREVRGGDGSLRFTDFQLQRAGRPIDSPTTGQDFDIALTYATADGRSLRGVNVAIGVTELAAEAPLLYLYSETAGADFGELPAHGEIRCHIPKWPLPAGQYYVNLWADISGEPLDHVSHAADMTVAAGDFYGSGRTPPAAHRTVMVDQEWSLTPVGRATEPLATRS